LVSEPPEADKERKGSGGGHDGKAFLSGAPTTYGLALFESMQEGASKVMEVVCEGWRRASLTGRACPRVDPLGALSYQGRKIGRENSGKEEREKNMTTEIQMQNAKAIKIDGRKRGPFLHEISTQL